MAAWEALGASARCILRSEGATTPVVSVILDGGGEVCSCMPARSLNAFLTLHVLAIAGGNTDGAAAVLSYVDVRSAGASAYIASLWAPYEAVRAAQSEVRPAMRRCKGRAQ